MSVDEISRHEVALFLTMDNTWKTSKDAAAQAGVAERTARLHLAKFATLGLVERAHLSPGYRYRSLQNRAPRTHAYVQRLQDAAEAFGMEVPAS